MNEINTRLKERIAIQCPANHMNKSQTTCPRFERPYALWCWGRQFTPPRHLFCTDCEGASSETCWYLYLYSQQHSRLCGDATIPPSHRRWREKRRGGERERGRKSTHTVLFLLVCKQCSTHGLYVYSVCVRVCLCVRALFSAHS